MKYEVLIFICIIVCSCITFHFGAYVSAYIYRCLVSFIVDVIHAASPQLTSNSPSKYSESAIKYAKFFPNLNYLHTQSASRHPTIEKLIDLSRPVNVEGCPKCT